MWNLRPWNDRLVERLNQFPIPPVTDPVEIRILWFKGYCVTGNSFVGNQSGKGGFHSHRFHELHFILNGEAVYDFGASEPVRMGQMQYLMIPPEMGHRELATGQECLRLSIGVELVSQKARERSSQLFREFDLSEYFVGTVNEKMLSLFENSLEEVKAPSFCTGYLLRNNVFHVLCEVLRQLKLGGHPSRGSGVEDLRLALAKRFVAENLGRAFTAEEVAAATGIGAKQLGRIFRRYEQCTLTEYIHSCRVSEAMHLITSTDLSLREISDRLGFSSEYYFNSFFKKHTGITPGNYRKS